VGRNCAFGSANTVTQNIVVAAMLPVSAPPHPNEYDSHSAGKTHSSEKPALGEESSSTAMVMMLTAGRMAIVSGGSRFQGTATAPPVVRNITTTPATKRSASLIALDNAMTTVAMRATSPMSSWLMAAARSRVRSSVHTLVVEGARAVMNRRYR